MNRQVQHDQGDHLSQVRRGDPREPPSYRWFTGDTAIWRFNSGPQILIAEQALVGLLGLLACLAGGVLASYTRALLRLRGMEPVTPHQ